MASFAPPCFCFNFHFQIQRSSIHLKALSIPTTIITSPCHSFTKSSSAAPIPLFITFECHRLCPPHCSTPIRTQTSTNDHHKHSTEIQYNLITEFLLNECGLRPFEVAKIMKRRATLSRARSTKTAREAVQFLRRSGFTQTQLKNTIVESPAILALKVDGLQPKIEFMKTLGLTDKDLGNVISKAPRLLTFSLDNNLRPKIPYLENLFGSKANLSKALLRSPELLVTNVDKQLKPKLDLLEQSGLQGELLWHLVSMKPDILSKSSIQSLKLKIKYVKDMGILEGSRMFVNALVAVAWNGPESLEKKLKYMASLGLEEDDIDKLLKKAPLILKFSMDKMQKNMDFLTHTAGLPPTVLLSYPSLLGYSLEKRLKPRHEVFKALCSMEQSKTLSNLVTMFVVGEKTFIKKVVERSPQAAVLHNIYKGESADLRVT